MRHVTRALLILAVGFGLVLPLGAQSGRGRASTDSGQTGRGAPAGRGGTGGAGGLFTYDPTASSGQVESDAPPTESHQKVTIHGEVVAYTARVGFLALRNATTDAPEAHIFYTYYAREGVTDPASRPLVFVVGGAPGVAAAWQEFAGLGPKRLQLSADGDPGLPPYGAVDNPDTVLDHADLVFANPIGTAYSRADSPAVAPTFWTTSGDAASLGEFVRGFLTTFSRWNSPRLLVGADAGTGRVTALALYLSEHQIPINGIALLSVTTAPDATAGDAAFLTLVPTEAVTAWAHHKLAADLQSQTVEAIADQAEQFAAREYLHALYQGDRMSAADRTKVTADLARLIGLPAAVVTSNDLRLTWDRFTSDLFRDDHLAVSPSDVRVTGYEAAPAGRGGRGGGRGFGAAAPAPPADPAEARLADGLLAGYLEYLAHDLGFTAGRGPFYLQTGGIGTYTVSGGDETALPGVLARNSRLKIFVAVDDFDASSPVGAVDFSVAHWTLPQPVRARQLTVDHLAAGRDAYADGKAAAKLHDDLARLIADVTTVNRPAPRLP